MTDSIQASDVPSVLRTIADRLDDGGELKRHLDALNLDAAADLRLCANALEDAKDDKGRCERCGGVILYPGHTCLQPKPKDHGLKAFLRSCSHAHGTLVANALEDAKDVPAQFCQLCADAADVLEALQEHHESTLVEMLGHEPSYSACEDMHALSTLIMRLRASGTLRNKDGSRSIFDDVDK